MNIFLDYLDEFGIRRYPILVVAHTSHKERWTVTNERLILVGPRDEQWIIITSLRALVSEWGEPSGNFFFDVHTAALMREHGIRRIASADKDFAKFSSLEVINPSRPDRI